MFSFALGVFFRADDATQGTGGITQTVSAPQGSNLPAGQTRQAPEFRPGFNIDTRDRNSQNSRPVDFRPFTVIDVRRYKDERGNPRLAFNQGAIHISLKQMTSAGVHYPESMVGKTILVDFFKPGDILLNGSAVTDDGRIVNRFALEPDQEVSRSIEKELALSAHNSWASQAALAYGANNRGSGVGMSNQLNNGVTSANQILQMQDPATATTSTMSPSQAQEAGGAAIGGSQGLNNTTQNVGDGGGMTGAGGPQDGSNG